MPVGDSAGRAPETQENIAHQVLHEQSVYIYKPSEKSKGGDSQLSKRRKLSHGPRESAQSDEFLFVPLLDGLESRLLVKHRYTAFKDFFTSQGQKLEGILHDADSKVVEDLTSFIKHAEPESSDSRISCGIISLGPNISSISTLLDQLRKHVRVDGAAQIAVLESGDCTNLKNALRTIIRNSIPETENGPSNYAPPTRLGPKLLPYDLELLHEFVRQNDGQKIVVAFKDSEAFDSDIMSDLISLLWSWRDRIPFVFLFGVATSMDLFEARLPRSTIGQLQAECFDICGSKDSIHQIFFHLEAHRDGTLWLGHNVSRLLVEQSDNQFQSPERFGNSLRYAYMSHFFANPLAALLAKEIRQDDFQPELCEAIRNLPSFQKHAEKSLERGDSKLVKKLLDDNIFLAQHSLENLKQGQQKMKRMFRCLETLKTVLEHVKPVKAPNMSSIVIQALAGELFTSRLVTDVLSTIKKLTSDLLEKLLFALKEAIPSTNNLYTQLQNLLACREEHEPLRTQYDSSRVTHKTALVAQRLKLMKGKAKLSNDEAKYTAIVEQLHGIFQKYLVDSLVCPDDMFLHEAFLYDFKSPLKDTFTPRPRFTMERALSNPSDYLAFDSDTSFENLSASQPETALLYQFYLESGALVNMYDLWRAFYTIVGGEDGTNYDERTALVMFYRATSELKMMGMMKPSRRKTDHLAKLSWMGL
ncbi:Origin recognition complex subunit 3 [Ophidiomyces ophidiicola]|uniref:Origin recognition complex subunit 3 n=1 Tax=Ophidiomyces ophidiicola TaxID=1387563 RepID=UPI0020C2C040|nr:Origin recognition complex subunit 3 [Ophidiomyces ophidiicola]KAI1929714.1 Origin recognition complex subunit 3 [Ophidiomyces ophidiicola]KAI1946484.1 Origin recognition complex subunit 3 [Ophidiomyces ophidiicola]KAI1960468.1 Origin recognition complex subunit 3 [Ophidiomyces ophidiicola]KAI1969408.1 Origin recognition complex subunit 3 [Ophidiomyces ophidiicola]KAI2051969.1 Origin recognition complex subunit 3 [Ophidiomyces ophidiicola]